MKTRIPIIFLFTLLLTTCRQKNEDEVLLIFPYTEYSDWVYFSAEYLTIKNDDQRLVIDTIYNLESDHFTIHSSEQLADYPAVARLLGRKLPELQKMEIDLQKTNCDPFMQTYVKYVNGQDTVLIELRDVTPCGTNDRWTLKGLDQELLALKEKYTR